MSGPGSALKYTPRIEPEALTGQQAREHLRRARKRVESLTDLCDRHVGATRRLREELRAARAENERLLRQARYFQEQAGMTPDHATQKEG